MAAKDIAERGLSGEERQSLSADAQGQRPSAAGLTPHVWVAEVNNRSEPVQFTRRADSD
jgi:hypothetical protein